MTEPRPPLPLPDVLEIVERRRRRRARARAVAGPALGVVAAGVGGVIVVVLQSGPGVQQPAAPPLSALPAPSTVTAAPSTVMAAPSTVMAAPSFPPLSRPVPAPLNDLLVPSYLVDAADAVAQESETERDDLLDDAAALATAWNVEGYPGAKAIVMKAHLTGEAIDPDDPRGDDELISRFERAGYTDDHAATLAQTWDTDVRTAKMIAALVVT